MKPYGFTLRWSRRSILCNFLIEPPVYDVTDSIPFLASKYNLFIRWTPCIWCYGFYPVPCFKIDVNQMTEIDRCHPDSQQINQMIRKHMPGANMHEIYIKVILEQKNNRNKYLMRAIATTERRIYRRASLRVCSRTISFGRDSITSSFCMPLPLATTCY